MMVGKKVGCDQGARTGSCACHFCPARSGNVRVSPAFNLSFNSLFLSHSHTFLLFHPSPSRKTRGFVFVASLRLSLISLILLSPDYWFPFSSPLLPARMADIAPSRS